MLPRRALTRTSTHAAHVRADQVGWRSTRYRARRSRASREGPPRLSAPLDVRRAIRAPGSRRASERKPKPSSRSGAPSIAAGAPAIGYPVRLDDENAVVGQRDLVLIVALPLHAVDPINRRGRGRQRADRRSRHGEARARSTCSPARDGTVDGDHRLRRGRSFVRRRRDGRRRRRRDRPRPRAAEVPGSQPWEIWLSEAQERMVVAVGPKRLPALRDRFARRHSVERSPTSAGSPATAASSSATAMPWCAELEHRLPAPRPASPSRMVRRACRPRAQPGRRVVSDPAQTLLESARPPQHRVQGDDDPPLRPRDRRGHGRAARSSACARTDLPIGVVIADRRDTHGRHRHRCQPVVRAARSGAMAHAAVDEAIRNVVAVGADPDRVALLDNFSWGDPAARPRSARWLPPSTAATTPPWPTGRRSSRARTR